MQNARAAAPLQITSNYYVHLSSTPPQKQPNYNNSSTLPSHVKLLTSPSNPFVKHCLKLRHSSSYRHSHASVLVVGTTPIRYGNLISQFFNLFCVCVGVCFGDLFCFWLVIIGSCGIGIGSISYILVFSIS